MVSANCCSSTPELIAKAAHKKTPATGKGRICFLGNNLLFRFFERISRSPNQFISYDVLLDEIWGGRREHSSIRDVAKRLRDRLELGGMAELSSKIDGSNSGFYRLILV